MASAAASEMFSFKSPYKMAGHNSSDNRLNWDEGHDEYKELHTFLNEAVAGFAHIYTYVVLKRTLFAGLTGRPIHNPEDLDCPPNRLFQSQKLVYIAMSQFPKFACATEIAHSLYDWLMYYPQKKDFVQCPPDMTRHSAEFVAAL